MELEVEMDEPEVEMDEPDFERDELEVERDVPELDTEVEVALVVAEEKTALDIEVADTAEDVLLALLAARTPVPETQSVRKATLRRLVNCIVMVSLC